MTSRSPARPLPLLRPASTAVEHRKASIADFAAIAATAAVPASAH